MRHFNRSSTYATSGLSRTGRQRSLPEIRHFASSRDNLSSATIGKKVLHLPLDKGNSRLLKTSVQNFLHQDGEDNYFELDRLKMGVELVESYCDQVCSGHVTSKERLDKIEQQITSLGQKISGFWGRVRTTPSGTADSSPTEEAPPSVVTAVSIDALLLFCTLLEDYGDTLGNYCKNLETQGYLSKYKWRDPEEVTAGNPYSRAEELMGVVQSREYQVRFCHANITLHYRKSPTANDYTTSSTIQLSTGSVAPSGGAEGDGEAVSCTKSLRNCASPVRLIIIIGVIILILLITTVILIIALR